jgi:hypothetical protein
MKKIFILLSALVTAAISSSGQGAPEYGAGMKINVNQDGSKFIRLIT